MNDRKWPPLWLPDGSLRALFTAAILIVALAMWYQGRDVPEELVGLVGGATSGYFLTRYNETKRTSENDTQETLRSIQAWMREEQARRAIEERDVLPGAREALEHERERVEA